MTYQETALRPTPQTEITVPTEYIWWIPQNIAGIVVTKEKVQLGECECTCRGCDDNTYHCHNRDRGCGM